MAYYREGRIAEVAFVAASVEVATKVPCESTVAQWAVESKWGTKPCGEHNYFGIKRASRHTEMCLVTTHEWYTESQLAAWNKRHPEHPARLTGKEINGKHEVLLDDEFADYGSLEASVRDYAWLVSNGGPYKCAWEAFLSNRDIAALVAGIAKAYSTSDSYMELVTSISRQANVVGPIAKARAALKS